MTPLAHHIAKQALDPAAMRLGNAQALVALVQDVHCFDLSDVFDLCIELADSYINHGAYDRKLVFLPALVTWIEFSPRGSTRWREFIGEQRSEMADTTRMACRITETDDALSVTFCFQRTDGTIMFEGLPTVFSKTAPLPVEGEKSRVAVIYAALAVINHPKIIGRRQHMPHRGLERQLVRRFGAGRFPLHAWTEIRLHVTPTRDARLDPSVEAHYTGARALHFCRAHLRLRGGRLEFVRSHWRGDPAIGIKQSRYRVVPPDKVVED